MNQKQKFSNIFNKMKKEVVAELKEDKRKYRLRRNETFMHKKYSQHIEDEEEYWKGVAPNKFLTQEIFY